MIEELMSEMSSWKKSKKEHIPVLEQIKELNRKNKEFYDSENHHKNVLKLFIPYEEPENSFKCTVDNREYNKEYVEERFKVFLDFVTEDKYFSHGVIERKSEGIYCAFLFRKVYLELQGKAEYRDWLIEFKERYEAEYGANSNTYEIIEKLFNKKWHYAKTSAIGIAEMFFDLRNHEQEYKGKEEYFGDILNYGENNMATKDELRKSAKKLTAWKPKEVQLLENVFKKENFEISVLDDLSLWADIEIITL